MTGTESVVFRGVALFFFFLFLLYIRHGGELVSPPPAASAAPFGAKTDELDRNTVSVSHML